MGIVRWESRGERMLTIENGVCFGCDLVLNITQETAAYHRPAGSGPCGWFHSIAWKRGVSQARVGVYITEGETR